MSSARFKLPYAAYRALLLEVSERDDFCCRICGEPNQTPHHIDRRSSGGGDYEENIISLCIFPNDCHGKVDRGQIEIPESELIRVGYYDNDQKRT